MNNIMDITYGHAFDEMDLCEVSYSYEEFLAPLQCALNEEPAEDDARCISIGSGSTFSDIISVEEISCLVTGKKSYSNIFEDYHILPTILGTGNYGCVRECLHRATGDKYAVKTIDKSKVSRLDHIEREIELLSSISHPGIMKMVDCYEDDNYVHIVTERYTGGELFDTIIANTTDYGCLNESQAAKIIKSLLEAVEYLHSKDIVHRDIKPENVLFESSEEGSSVKLIDFGLSRRHGLNDVYMTTGVGTPYYMSPAVLQGKYDRSCDLWAIGVVSYILLCGYPPFNGNNDYEVQESTLRCNLVFEKFVWGKLSDSSRDFVSKLLSMDSSKIGTASEALQHPWIACA